MLLSSVFSLRERTKVIELYQQRECNIYVFYDFMILPFFLLHWLIYSEHTSWGWCFSVTINRSKNGSR